MSGPGKKTFWKSAPAYRITKAPITHHWSPTRRGSPSSIFIFGVSHYSLIYCEMVYLTRTFCRNCQFLKVIIVLCFIDNKYLLLHSFVRWVPVSFSLFYYSIFLEPLSSIFLYTLIKYLFTILGPIIIYLLYIPENMGKKWI